MDEMIKRHIRVMREQAGRYAVTSEEMHDEIRDFFKRLEKIAENARDAEAFNKELSDRGMDGEFSEIIGRLASGGKQPSKKRRKRSGSGLFAIFKKKDDTALMEAVDVSPSDKFLDPPVLEDEQH